jgi:DNA-binding NtrC family response regulator
MSNSFNDSLDALSSDPVSGLHPIGALQVDTSDEGAVDQDLGAEDFESAPSASPRPSQVRIAVRLPDSGIDFRNAVESFENQLICQALERTGWNKKQAAALLGLNRTTLVEMLKRKHITRAA